MTLIEQFLYGHLAVSMLILLLFPAIIKFFLTFYTTVEQVKALTKSSVLDMRAKCVSKQKMAGGQKCRLNATQLCGHLTTTTLPRV